MEEVKSKKCTKCEQIKPLEEYHNSKRGILGKNSYCKPCASIHRRKHYIQNKEKSDMQSRIWAQNNKEKRATYDKRYKENNKEKVALRKKNWQQSNKEKCNESNLRYARNNKNVVNLRNKKWRDKNPDKISFYRKNYILKNPEVPAEKAARYRAKRLNATPVWSEKEKIKLLYKKAKWLESITGLKYHVDHIVPLQGKNCSGLHVWMNLQILESSINEIKSNKF